MRPVHGSMMDAVVACPGDAERLPARLAAAAWPDPASPRVPPLAWAPLARGAALQSLCSQVAGRHTAQSVQVGLALPALALDTGAWQEGLALAQAALHQWASLQTAWVEGLTELATEMGQLRQANTVSKYVDQEMNLVQQSMALAASQLTASARLAENVQNNLAFWMSQHAGAAAQWPAADTAGSTFDGVAGAPPPAPAPAPRGAVAHRRSRTSRRS